MPLAMDLTVGPNLFFWSPQAVRAFYEDVAAAPVARVVLGEVVCSKRLPFWQDDILHDPVLYRLRHRIENMFARLKDWRRIATRYDRCADLFLSACALAATILFWL